MFIRLSSEKDKYKIDGLIRICFGNRNDYGVLDNLNGRYLLAFEDDKLIAMTGIFYSKVYEGCEIDWTCTRPGYRRQGIMRELFRRLCSMTDDRIYCSCWRIGDYNQPNLAGIMKSFGFKEIMRPRVTLDSRYNCECGKSGMCVMQELEDGVRKPCRCYEDLYMRECLEAVSTETKGIVSNE